MKTIGSWMQAIGLIVLPVAMVLELTNALERDGVADMLLFMVFGFAIFYLGRIVEGYADNSKSK